jgi:pimeloyl-ACP methyl ester carboxylesterase
VAALAPHGLDVVLLEYPGYGARPGSPSRGALTSAAVEAVDALAAEGGPVWLVGESLGSGVAARAAALRSARVGGLLLVTPFADLAAVARLHYPFVPAALVPDRYRPQVDLAAFRGPVVVLVAGRDEVVSADQGRLLHAALPGPKLLLEQPGATHNGLDLAPASPFWREAVSFLGASGR